MPTFDCFASFNNKETSLYCAKEYDLISPFWDFLSNGENCLVPKDQIFWANPPFEKRIVEKTLAIFLKYALTSYILSPMIPQLESINNELIATASAHIILNPHPQLFLPASTNYLKSVGPPKFKTLLALINMENCAAKIRKLSQMQRLLREQALAHCRATLDATTSEDVVIFTDGASLNNPGPAGAAALIKWPYDITLTPTPKHWV